MLTIVRILVTIAILVWLATIAFAQERPNFIFMMADDMGYGDWPNAKIDTPNLDALAADGTRLTSFYAAPICTPSRAALMTGRYQVRDGWGPVLNSSSPDGIDQPTVADKLKTGGYATALIGKWHLGRLPQYLPTRHGFDQFYGYMQDTDMVLYRNETVVDTTPPREMLTKMFTAEAVQFINQNKSRPFFLYMAYNAPHVPLHPNPDFAGDSARGAYGDVVEEMDWSVGRIMAALVTAGISDNTLIIFTSDNGPWLEKGSAGGSAYPLSGGKLTVLEGGIREPFIAHWPGHVPAGRTINSPAMNVDIFPTFSQLAGLTISNPSRLDGKDISPLLFGTGARAGNNEFLFYNMLRLRAFRSGNWKVHFDKDGRATRLYNLATDIREATNLAGSQPTRMRDLATRAKQLDAAIPRDAPPKH